MGARPGTLHEGATDLVERLVPPPSMEDRVHGLGLAQAYLHALGITAWQDAIVTPVDLAAYRAFAGRGDLTARVVACHWWERARGPEQIEAMIEERRISTIGRLRATTVKIMQDGVIENYTAAMLASYLGADGQPTGNRGLSQVDPEALKQDVTLLDAEGFQVHVHALGDRAVREALDAIEAALAANGPTDGRHHLAHLQVVDRADMPRFRQLGVAANIQPLWAARDDQMVDLTLPFITPAAGALQYPFRSLRRAGAMLVGGSDWTVSTPNVLMEVETAVNRVSPYERERPPLLPDEAIDLVDGLAAFTIGSAYVNHLDDVTGSVRGRQVGGPRRAGPRHRDRAARADRRCDRAADARRRGARVRSRRPLIGAELAALDALGQAELVRRGEVTALELAEAALGRIDQLNPIVNAVITRFDAAARTAATTPPPLPGSPLAGAPFLLKDLGSPLGGIRQTAGSRSLLDAVAPADGELVRRYKRAGLIIVGKTNTPEFGNHSTTEPVAFGPTRNPWATERTAGGSSGGSAAAVASGMVPAAHGGDGAGSIRIPASCCGLVGLKTTRGRVPRAPGHELGASLSVEHVITRSVRDSAAFLDATAGAAAGDAFIVPPPARTFLSEVSTDPGRLRIGWTARPPIEADVDPACVGAVRSAAELLASLGHEVEEAAPTFDGDVMLDAMGQVWAASNAASAAAAGGPDRPAARSR